MSNVNRTFHKLHLTLLCQKIKQDNIALKNFPTSNPVLNFFKTLAVTQIVEISPMTPIPVSISSNLREAFTIINSNVETKIIEESNRRKYRNVSDFKFFFFAFL